MLNILLASAEAAPFAGDKGFGTMVGALAGELRKKGMEVRVILPKHGSFREEFAGINANVITQFTVPLSWRRQLCKLEMANYRGIIFYFVDNEYYFDREAIYGFEDDGERYAFFCRAVLESIPHLGFSPHIVHCHEWHTGMIGAFWDAWYKERPEYRELKTVFSVHNHKEQGNFERGFVEDVLGLGWNYFQQDGVECGGYVNFLKSGVNFAHKLTLASRQYVQEIKEPRYGGDMSGVWRRRGEDLQGILYGLDYTTYNPAQDAALFVTYDSRALKKRRQNKTELQKRLGLKVDEGYPMAAVDGIYTWTKDWNLIVDHAKELMMLGLQLVITIAPDETERKKLLAVAEEFPGTVTVCTGEVKHIKRMYAAADICLVPCLGEPCGIAHLIAMRYGCLPVARSFGGLKDTIVAYSRETGEGTGFLFEDGNGAEMVEAVRTALAVMEDKKIWSGLVRSAMKGDYSWQRPVEQYQSLFRQLIQPENGL
jgi:starch synthase